MIDGEYLLAAILDDPADDLARLAYADWCEEEGDDARAELIRLQVAHGERVESQGDPTHPQYQRRDATLLAEHGGEWLCGLATMFGLSRYVHDYGYCGGGAGFPKWSWRRGFVDTITLRLEQWRLHGRRLVRQHPIESLTITDKEPAYRWNSSSSLCDWRWYIVDVDEPLGDDASRLPHWVYHNGPLSRYGAKLYGCHKSEGDARSVLSRQLLDLAKIGRCMLCDGVGQGRFIERTYNGERDDDVPLGRWEPCPACSVPEYR